MSDVVGPIVLGLETSCDETSAAVLAGDDSLLGHVILSQDVHEVYGGVVPELAARAHLQKVDAVVDEALARAGVTFDDIDVIGVTAGPGLIGALLVGVCWAKAVAWGLDKPLVPVHHMEAHLFAPGIEDAEAEPPFIGLLVSGGHTMLLHVRAWGDYVLLGQTRDDAAGEAFDKVAKLLGLPYPGGPSIQRVAAEGDPKRHPLPRPMLRRNQKPDQADYYDFSFSGLKTAVVERVHAVRGSDGDEGLEREVPHIAAAFQAAAVDVLVAKTLRAVQVTGCPRVVMGGGVSANTLLREQMTARLERAEPGGRVFYASPRLSLDNGAMVARAARFRFERGDTGGLNTSAFARLPFPGLSSTEVAPMPRTSRAMYPVFFELPDWVPFLGGQPITSFGVFMLLSFLTAGYVLRAELRRTGEDPEKAWDFVFMAVVGGIVGAKGYYVLLNWQQLLADPVGSIMSRGGLVWYGGFLLATALVIYEIRRQKMSVPTVADLIAPALALAYAVGRVGCFMVGDDWGRPTDSFLGVKFPRGTPATTVQNIEQMFGITVDPALIEKHGQVIPVHPTQLYEVGLSTLIFFVLWRMREHRHQKGWLFLLWLVLAGIERFAVEFLRAKDDRFFGVLTLAQIISLGIVAFGLAGLVRMRGSEQATEAA